MVSASFKDYRKPIYYLCGPSGFMEEIIWGLYDLEIPEESIHVESFDGSVALLPAANDGSPVAEGSVEVMIGKHHHSFMVRPQRAILDRALVADLNVDYSCRSGNCSTCKARLVQGQATTRNTKGLTDEEIKAGYILTCQSQPAYDHVRLEYDS